MSSCCGWACVNQANVGIVERFGEYEDVLPPGASFIGCFHDLKGEVSLRTRLMSVHTVSATSDRVMVELKTTIMYHVIPSECHTAFYSLQSVKQIGSFVDNSVRAEIAGIAFENLFVSKEKISTEVRKLVFPELSSRGFEVDEVLIKDIKVPREIVQASERQLEMRYVRQANRYRAEANKIEITTRAEAEAQVKRLSGVGQANMQKGVASGFGDALDQWQGGDESAEVMAMILLQQYMNTMDAMTSKKAHTIFMPGVSLMHESI